CPAGSTSSGASRSPTVCGRAATSARSPERPLPPARSPRARAWHSRSIGPSWHRGSRPPRHRRHRDDTTLRAGARSAMKYLQSGGFQENPLMRLTLGLALVMLAGLWVTNLFLYFAHMGLDP